MGKKENIHAILQKNINILDAPFAVCNADNTEFLPEVIIEDELKPPFLYAIQTSTFFSGIINIITNRFGKFLTLVHCVDQ